MANNFITAFPDVVFEMESVTHLNLSSNYIKQVPEVPANVDVSLTALDLSGNKLADVLPICDFKRLESLKLSNNEVSYLPDKFRQLQKLQTLHMQFNHLRSIEALSEMISLKYVYLSNNSIDKVPLHLLFDLRVLALQHNVIEEMDDDLFDRMDQLQTLALNDNCLLKLPSSIGKLVGLNRMFLHENALVYLPEEIGQCVELTSLRVEYNELKSIPSELENLKFLMVLIAHNNKLTSFPDFVNNMPQLLRYSFEFNRFAIEPKRSGPGGPGGNASIRTDETTSSFDDRDFKAFIATNDFNKAFEHFVESRDLSRTKTQNFINGPAQAKLVLMRQHRDGVFLNLYLSGRLENELTDNVAAIAAHQMDPRQLVRVLKETPNKTQLLRLASGLQEFPDAWFALFLEYGGFDEVLKLLHRMYLQKSDDYRSECLMPCLQIFSIVFDAVWKTVLVTHSSVPVLLLHLNSTSPEVSLKVLEMVLEIARIPDVGAAVLLKGLSMRKRMVGDGAARLQPFFSHCSKDSSAKCRVLVLRIFNAILEQTPLSDRKLLRGEFLSLHPVSAKAFLELLDSLSVWDSELSFELDTFIDMLKEDHAKLRQLAQRSKQEASKQEKVGTEESTDTISIQRTETETPSSKAKLKLKECPFDVTSVPPLPKLRKKDLVVSLTDKVHVVCKRLVEEYNFDKNQDYCLYFKSKTGDDVYFTDEKSLNEYPDIVDSDNKNTTRTMPLFFSLRSLTMAVRLPSGETRSVPMILQSHVKDVLSRLRAEMADNLPAEGDISLAIDDGKQILKEGESFVKQGVEPYHVLHVVTEADISALKTREQAAGGPEPPSDEPLGNIWDEPYTPKYVVVENGELQSASMNKIIERMTSIDTIDLQLSQTFLSSYKSFTTAEETWSKLKERYNVPAAVSEDEKRKVRVRICMFVKKWLEVKRTGDIKPDLMMEIMDFIEKTLPEDGLQDMQGALLKLLTGSASEKVITYDRKQAPKVKHPKVRVLDKMTVMDIDPAELARQITLKTWEMFCLIQPIELFNQAWMKKDR